MISDDYLTLCATEVGIELAHFVDIDILNEIHERFIEYKSEIPFFKGKFEKRLYIKNEWEKAESAISFAVSYNTDDKAHYDKEHVVISKCSRGIDYHIVLKELGTKLAEALKQYYEFDYRVFVDTGILSDRMLAYSSGLGFIGNNNFLINEKYGSFIFIGHILLDTNIEHDRIKCVDNKCGYCDFCLKACPMRAYNDVNSFDYSKCISFLNQSGIEFYKTNYIYGCDICQNVCPFNKNAVKTIHNEFIVDEKLYSLPNDEALSITKEQFDKTYSDSSLYWRGFANFKKNVDMVILKRKHEPN